MQPTTSRRRFLAAALAGASAGVVGSARSADRETTEARPPESVGLETLATGMYVPLDVAFAPDADRRYVADKDGRVHVHESDGLRDELFLDLRDAVELDLEMGLLGIALHPNFAENRRAFVRYSAPRRPGTPEDYSHTFVLAEFEATADGRRAIRDTERAVLEIPQPQNNHNAGSIVFGPDGYLYVGVGDGGNGGDLGPGHVDDWYDAVGGGNGQDVTENLLGSVLRIDVDGDASGTARTDTGEAAAPVRNYAVPDDNPLVGEEGLDEQYAWGFRNPWRMSFDVPESPGDSGANRTSSGDGTDLFVADVGQTSYEEVSLVEKGGNYGWNVKEGAHCYAADDCPDATPDSVRGGEPLRDPIVEYPHSYDRDSEAPPVSGNSVIGGYVYRGTALPELEGVYVFADLDSDGRLFAATPTDGDETWRTEVVEVTDADRHELRRIFSFGRDRDGEVYVLGSAVLGAEDEVGGGLHRLVPAE